MEADSVRRQGREKDKGSGILTVVCENFHTLTIHDNSQLQLTCSVGNCKASAVKHIFGTARVGAIHRNHIVVRVIGNLEIMLLVSSESDVKTAIGIHRRRGNIQQQVKIVVG